MTASVMFHSRAARPVKRLLGVGVLDLAQVGRHRRRIVAVRLGIGDARLADDVVVIDEPRIVRVTHCHAQRELVLDQRHVDDAVQVVTDAVALAERIGPPADLEFGLARVGPVRDVADGAAERARAIQRALRAEQRLDALQVEHLEVDEERDVAEVGRDRAARAVAHGLAGIDRADVQAAHRHQVAAAGTLVGHEQARDGARELGQVGDAQVVEVAGAERHDVERDVLDVRLAAGRRDDDFLEHGAVVGHRLGEDGPRGRRQAERGRHRRRDPRRIPIANHANSLPDDPAGQNGPTPRSVTQCEPSL